jgi:formylmethanofuran dehydrogenase subunit A
MNAVRENEPERLKAFPRLAARRRQGLCAETRESRRRGSLEAIPSGNVTVWTKSSSISASRRGRSFARSARAANELGLPHPACTSIAINSACPATGDHARTMRALEGFRGHLTHIQFHSYGGGDADENTFNSKVQPLADYVNAIRISPSTSARCCSAKRPA